MPPTIVASESSLRQDPGAGCLAAASLSGPQASAGNLNRSVSVIPPDSESQATRSHWTVTVTPTHWQCQFDVLLDHSESVQEPASESVATAVRVTVTGRAPPGEENDARPLRVGQHRDSDSGGLRPLEFIPLGLSPAAATRPQPGALGALEGSVKLSDSESGAGGGRLVRTA